LRLDGFDLDLVGFDAAELEAMFDAAVGEEKDPAEETGINYQEHFAVLVDCNDSAHQEQVYNALLEQGYSCKVLVN
jgi:hypothetical protein